MVGRAYSRPTLAELWGYRSYHAIARGVVAPRGQNVIVLFVTRDKQESLEQYEDRLTASSLHWEGPTDHFAEDRMVSAALVGDELHLFIAIVTIRISSTTDSWTLSTFAGSTEDLAASPSA